MPWSDEMIPPEESIHDAQLDSIAEDEMFLPWPNWPAPPLLGPDDEDDDFDEEDDDDYDEDDDPLDDEEEEDE